MSRRAECWLGDLLVACEALAIDTREDVRRIAKLLVPLGIVSVPEPEPTLESLALPRDRPPPTSAAGATATATTRTSAAPAADDRAEIPSHLVEVTRELEDLDMPTRPLALEGGRDWQEVPSPLFEPGSARATVRELASVRARSGGVDLEAIVKLAIRCEPLERLPRRSTFGARFGVDLLVDIAPDMAGFSLDTEELRVRLNALLGAGQVRTLYFDSDPTVAGPGRRSEWRRYEIPSMARRLLLVTRLDRPSSEVVYGAFVSRIPPSCGTPLALVPHRAADSPRALASRLPIVAWDRGTTTAVARRAADGEASRG